jgi:ABC-type tungstate transport system permease subunit
VTTEQSPAASLALASTVGPIDAGIMPALVAAYPARTGVEIALTGAGTGKTLDLARGGGFDVVLVPAPALEQRFVDEGYGLCRHELMANDFVLVELPDDPAGVRGLIEAAALGRYTLLDRATVLTLGETPGLAVLLEGDPLLLNVISVLPANPARVRGVRSAEAARFVGWLLGDETQPLIALFGVARYGQPCSTRALRAGARRRDRSWADRCPRADGDAVNAPGARIRRGARPVRFASLSSMPLSTWRTHLALPRPACPRHARGGARGAGAGARIGDHDAGRAGCPAYGHRLRRLVTHRCFQGSRRSLRA